MPTIKQKRAAKEVAENGGNVSQGMIAAGYSPATAKTPQKLTESKGWEELMETYLPDALLAQKHMELLDRVDHQAVSKGLDMAYKLKGKYAPEKVDHTTKGKALPQAINIIQPADGDDE